MRRIDKIVIHCADTPAGMNIGVETIRKWHTDPKPKGNGWSEVGYHYVITRAGNAQTGRPESAVGAHVAGHNKHSIAVCLVGGKPFANFTRKQWRALESLVEDLTGRYPHAEVCGHHDLANGKTCPTFDAQAWWYG